jgi:hypothetical protein
MAPMEVDLTFNGGCVGKLKLPQVKTSSSGAQVNISNQHIKVLDMACFKAFVKSLVTDEKLVLALDNGKCTIKALGMTGHCTYKKEVHLKGMNGPVTKFTNTTDELNTMVVTNPSPVEIDHGISTFLIQTGAGERLAELRGPMLIKRGESEVTMDIYREDGLVVAPSAITDMKLVGSGTEDGAWTDETIKFIQTPITLTEQFYSFFRAAPA